MAVLRCAVQHPQAAEASPLETDTAPVSEAAASASAGAFPVYFIAGGGRILTSTDGVMWDCLNDRRALSALDGPDVGADIPGGGAV